MLESSVSTGASVGARRPRFVRVLVIEDDFGDYDAVARALRKMVHFEAKPTRAKTLEAARKLMSECIFDVLLIDYNLGAECGARFLKEIGGRAGSAVPILLTGLLDREVHENALSAGAIGCINKGDLSPTLLETTIRYALYTHSLEVEVAALLRSVAASAEGPLLAERLARLSALDNSNGHPPAPPLATEAVSVAN